MSERIGLDLDNTIIRYDEAFLAAASERGLLPPGTYTSKREIRDAVTAAASDLEWQKLQGYVYGRGIHHASLYPGVLEFLAIARAQGRPLVIISHKTQFGHFDETQTDLRTAARGFLQEAGVLEYFAADAVLFCPTRSAKLEAIGAAQCAVFIDDLEDILADPEFPVTTRPLHFSVDGHGREPAFPHLRTWDALRRTVFEPDHVHRG